MDKNKLKEKLHHVYIVILFIGLWGWGLSSAMCAGSNMLSVFLLVSSVGLTVEYYYCERVKTKQCSKLNNKLSKYL